MGDLKRTVLYEDHVAAGATMVDFGGWDMPVQYPSGIVAEHLYTRSFCSLFDVSHMGRLLVEGPDRVAFLQHVVTSNVAAIEPLKAQYCIIPDTDGSAIDDAYLYRFEEDRILFVVNASNTEKDKAYLNAQLAGYDCRITDISDKWAAIAVQGPKSRDLMEVLSGGVEVTPPVKNALNSLCLEGHEAKVANTGYTGEPVGFEVYVKTEDASWLWNRLIELGAKPAGLGARDTLRLEAGYPLYGHEMGKDPSGQSMPIFAVPLASFAVNFAEEKDSFVGREALAAQKECALRIKNKDFSDIAAVPRRIKAIELVDRGVMRAGMEVYRDGKLAGWVTSGTMVPCYLTEGEGAGTVLTDQVARRAIGLCYVDSDLRKDDIVEVDVRGRRLKAKIKLKHIKTGESPYVTAV